MVSLFKRTSLRQNRIENVGRWPLRLTNFFLCDDYEFPPSNYAEIFLVREGAFLHETDNGTQALRRGALMVNHPSNRHAMKQTEALLISRIRFLPEWFARDYQTIVEAPDVLSLFFSQSWFQYPSDTTLHVFSAREEALVYLEKEFELLQEALGQGRQLEPIVRVTMLKLMLLIGDEYHLYWRGRNWLDLRPEIRTTMDAIEESVADGESSNLKDLKEVVGMSQDHLGRLFRKATGITLVDYAQRRRNHHAALRLLTTAETARGISESLGFTDSAHFTKSFQKYFNLSPNVYRQKFGTPESEN
jgi:AraC-like DNA-binding protein